MKIDSDHCVCFRLEQAQTAQRMVADDKEDLERQLQDIACAKVSYVQDSCKMQIRCLK